MFLGAHPQDSTWTSVGTVRVVGGVVVSGELSLVKLLVDDQPVPQLCFGQCYTVFSKKRFCFLGE